MDLHTSFYRFGALFYEFVGLKLFLWAYKYVGISLNCAL